MRIINKLFAFCIILLCYTSAYAEESYSLCFYNDDTFFVTVYFTKEECLEEAQTDNYILNGVNLSDNQVDFCDDIAEVHILDSTVYCKREYIKVAPIMVDHFVLSRTIQRETPLISNIHSITDKSETRLTPLTDTVDILGYINGYYYAKYENEYGFIDSWSVFTYAFDDLVIPQMIDMETIRQISMKHIKQKYNVDSIEEYHVDIGLYTCAKKLEESWYVVNIYPETSEYDLYSVWINCMTGEIILDDFAKHSLG